MRKHILTYPNFKCCHDMQDQGNKQTGGLTLPLELPYHNDRQKSPEKVKAELQESFEKSKQDREAKTEQSKKERQQRQKQKERDKDGSICYSLLSHCLILAFLQIACQCMYSTMLQQVLAMCLQSL
jgi:cation transport ATPase